MRFSFGRRAAVRVAVATSLVVGPTLVAGPAGIASAVKIPVTGCQPTACSPVANIGLTTTTRKGTVLPAPAAAGLYGWGAATDTDGSVLLGDFWNYRIVHYQDNEVNGSGGNPATPATAASPYVFSQSKLGFGPDTNQTPFGLCVDGDPSSPFYGYVYMTEGSMFAVNQYYPSGVWHTSWGKSGTSTTNTVDFDYPSQCAVNPSTGLVYISNQWGKSLVILNPSTNQVQFVTPPSPNEFIQPRGLAIESAGNLWVADQGHKRIDIFYASDGPNLNAAPQETIPAPKCDPSVSGCTTTSFDMRGLAIDTTNNLAFVANGQGCVVQEFNADPSSPDLGQFILNFNGVPAGGSNCGTDNGQFVDGARDIAVDGNHDVWVGDLGDFRAQVFDESGNFQFAVPNPPAPPPTGGFNGPHGIAFDSNGNMYVTDMYNERVEEFSDSSGTWNYTNEWGIRGDTPSTFNYPRLACWDPLTQDRTGQTGALIVANTDSNMLVAWNVANNPPTVAWATGGKPRAVTDPYGVACDPASGDVYAANSNGRDVAVFDSSGDLLGHTGSGVINGFSRGIWVDSDGSVWVDIGNGSDTIYHFASWANGGGFLGSFNPPKNSTPYGIAGDANYLYVALSGANVVAQYTRSGTLVGTFGGRGQYAGEMNAPQGLAFGPDGNLYITDEGNNRVSIWSVP